MKNYLRKIIACSILVLFLNLSFVIFAREAYVQIDTFTPLLIFNIVLCLDIAIRPISSEKDQFKYPKLSILLFLLLPFIVILPYLENCNVIQHYLKIWDSFIIYIIGISLLIIGGIILIDSRLLLGKFGSSKIAVEKHHYLITRGFYRYIRHPMYLGMLLVFFGFALSFRSLISPFIFLFGLFLLFKNRMDSEERVLKEKFGKEYETYMKKTKRLIPFIY